MGGSLQFDLETWALQSNSHFHSTACLCTSFINKAEGLLSSVQVTKAVVAYASKKYVFGNKTTAHIYLLRGLPSILKAYKNRQANSMDRRRTSIGVSISLSNRLPSFRLCTTAPCLERLLPGPNATPVVCSFAAALPKRVLCLAVSP